MPTALLRVPLLEDQRGGMQRLGGKQPQLSESSKAEGSVCWVLGQKPEVGFGPWERICCVGLGKLLYLSEPKVIPCEIDKFP